MKLIPFSELVWFCVSIRLETVVRTIDLEGSAQETVTFNLDPDTSGQDDNTESTHHTHHTAFIVGGSQSESVMLDSHNVKEIIVQILTSEGLNADTNIVKVEKSDDDKYTLCEWTSDVSKDVFANVYKWPDFKYAALNQWAHTTLQPKIEVTSPSGTTTTDMNDSHFHISKMEPFEWDPRPKQYRMVSIKVTGSKTNDLIQHKNLEELLEHVLVNTSVPNHPLMKVEKTVLAEKILRVGFVTKMTEDEISEKLMNLDLGPLNDWIRYKFPKILDDGSRVNSTVHELKIYKIKTIFDSDWYTEYNKANPGRRGQYTHLTAFAMAGTLSEKLMLDRNKMKELLEHIIKMENHMIENNHVTIMKLEKSDNKKFILCEWMSDVSKEAFDSVLKWTETRYGELNKWARSELYRIDHGVMVAGFSMTSGMSESDFKIYKMMPFKWDIRDEGLQMVSIRVTGSKRSKVVENIGLKTLLEKALTDLSDPNHPNIEIFKTAPDTNNAEIQRVAFTTKIPPEEITEKLASMDYGPLNEWAKNQFTVNNTVSELKIFKLQDDFELSWYVEWYWS